jgi:hypothetical protein
MVAGTDATASLSQQRIHDGEPLRFEGLPANGLACATVPVGGIALIAFLTVQVSVNPRAIAFVLLGRFVCSRPIAFGIPPQPGEGVRESGWRIGCGQRLTKFI